MKKTISSLFYVIFFCVPAYVECAEGLTASSKIVKKTNYIAHPSDSEFLIRVSSVSIERSKKYYDHFLHYDYCRVSEDQSGSVDFKDCTPILPSSGSSVSQGKLGAYNLPSAKSVSNSRELKLTYPTATCACPMVEKSNQFIGRRPEMYPDYYLGKWPEAAAKRAYFKLKEWDGHYAVKSVFEHSGTDYADFLTSMLLVTPVSLGTFAVGSKVIWAGANKVISRFGVTAAKKLTLKGLAFTTDLFAAGGLSHEASIYSLRAKTKLTNVAIDSEKSWALSTVSRAQHAVLLSKNYLDSALNLESDFEDVFIIQETVFQNLAQFACFLGRALYMGAWDLDSETHAKMLKNSSGSSPILFRDKFYTPDKKLVSSRRVDLGFDVKTTRKKIQSRCFKGSQNQPRTCTDKLFSPSKKRIEIEY